MEQYCQNPYCQNLSVRQVPVSVEGPADQVRALCAACEEAYSWGVQHGRMSQRPVTKSNSEDIPMLDKLYDAIQDVLESLDAGGEQSRQFAEEIRTLRQVIGHRRARPKTESLKPERRRRL